jgi:hypothetical protein
VQSLGNGEQPLRGQAYTVGDVRVCRLLHHQICRTSCRQGDVICSVTMQSLGNGEQPLRGQAYTVGDVRVCRLLHHQICRRSRNEQA